jgi:hypothetical protein
MTDRPQMDRLFDALRLGKRRHLQSDYPGMGRTSFLAACRAAGLTIEAGGCFAPGPGTYRFLEAYIGQRVIEAEAVRERMRFWKNWRMAKRKPA